MNILAHLINRIRNLLTALKHDSKKKNNSIFVVAESCKGLIMYEKKDLDKVIESNGYTHPITVQEFANQEDAIAFLRDHSDEYPAFEDDDLSFWDEEYMY